MTACLFIRAYKPDFGWLVYTLRSIQKFATGFSEVIIVVPEGQETELSHLTAETVIPVFDGQPGYMGQQCDKLNADKHTQAEFVCNLDADCVFTQPVTPQDFMVNDKPRWLMTPWKDCMDAKKAWFGVMAKCLQEAPEHEFMRRHGIMVPRWAYAEFRGFIEKTHGVPIESYVMNQPGNEYSEFNTLGFWLWLNHRDKIAWHNTSEMGVPPNPLNQEHSWSGLTDEIRVKLEAILA